MYKSQNNKFQTENKNYLNIIYEKENKSSNTNNRKNETSNKQKLYQKLKKDKKSVSSTFNDYKNNLETISKNSYDKLRLNLHLYSSFNNKNEELNIKYDQDTLSKILIFLICYKDEIYDMLEIFYSLDKYLPNFLFDWKNIISNKEINYEINENFPEYTRDVNESFFIIYESLIKCIFKYQGYKQISDDNFYEYLDSIKKISKTAIQIYYKLYLPSKEMYTLQILINIFTSFDSCKNKKQVINIKEIFINIIDNINNENYLIEKGDYEILERNYKTLEYILDNLIDKKNNEKEYSLLLNNLFIYRFK
jgi:hypothetical protein